MFCITLKVKQKNKNIRYFNNKKFNKYNLIQIICVRQK